MGLLALRLLKKTGTPPLPCPCGQGQLFKQEKEIDVAKKSTKPSLARNRYWSTNVRQRKKEKRVGIHNGPQALLTFRQDPKKAFPKEARALGQVPIQISKKYRSTR